WAIQQLLVDAMSNRVTLERLKPLISERADMSTWNAIMAPLSTGLAQSRQGLAAAGLQPESALDFALSLMTLEKKGDADRGYRIHGTAREFNGGMPPLY